MGFGGGFWRCPGRFFAEMELALLLQLVLMQVELTPEKQQQQDQSTAAYDYIPKQYASQKSSSSSFVQCVLDVAVFGLGMRGGSSKQEQQWRASGVKGQLFKGSKAAAAAADDRKVGVRLPRPELRRLVGLKVPAEPWWVTAAGVTAAGVLYKDI
jgi:hypothetical protein